MVSICFFLCCFFAGQREHRGPPLTTEKKWGKKTVIYICKRFNTRYPYIDDTLLDGPRYKNEGSLMWLYGEEAPPRISWLVSTILLKNENENLVCVLFLRETNRKREKGTSARTHEAGWLGDSLSWFGLYRCSSQVKVTAFRLLGCAGDSQGRIFNLPHPTNDLQNNECGSEGHSFFPIRSGYLKLDSA